MSLCHYFAVNILLFLICLDKHISRDYFFLHVLPFGVSSS